MKATYAASSIRVFEGLDAVRKRAGINIRRTGEAPKAARIANEEVRS